MSARDRRDAVALDAAFRALDECSTAAEVLLTLAVGARRLAGTEGAAVLTRRRPGLAVEATSGRLHVNPRQALPTSTSADRTFVDGLTRVADDAAEPLVAAMGEPVRPLPVIGLARPVALLALAGSTPHDESDSMLAVLGRHAGVHLIRLWDAEVRVDLLEQRAAAMGSLRRLADTDSLTGLANRTGVFRVLDSLVNHHQQVGVVFVDLDDFKEVNDRYGHQAGDDVLREVAGRLRELVRPTDIVGRLGGDEFVLVLPEATAPAAQAVVERVPEALAEPVCTGGVAIEVHASSGMAVSHGELSPKQLLHLADRSMYDRKKPVGRSRLELLPRQRRGADS